MKQRHHLIEHLYGETGADAPPLSELLKDPELREEYQILSEARFALDRQHRARPDRARIDAIVAAARSPERPAQKGRWSDRAAIARALHRRRLPLAGLTLAAAIVFALWVTPWTGSSPEVLPPVADAREAPAPDLQLGELPPAAPIDLTGGSEYEWDRGDDVRRLSRRIKALMASGELAWDDPAVPLEMLPGASASASGLTPASTQR